MDYQNTLLYLYNSVPMFQQVGSSAYKEGLENTLALDEHFSTPCRLPRAYSGEWTIHPERVCSPICRKRTKFL